MNLWADAHLRAHGLQRENGLIKITIERTTLKNFTETQQFCVLEVPTEIVEEDRNYSGNTTKKVQYQRTYEPREIPKVKEIREILVTQEIANDEDFDLKAVIKAINKI
jgi:hypothetical protein